MPEESIVPRPPLPPSWRDRIADLADTRAAVLPSLPTVAGALAVVAAIALAAYLLLRQPAPPPELSLPMAGSNAEPTVPATTSPAQEVVVHAAGAVARPGLYRLPPGSRVADLVDAAGGFTADADPDRINLAAPLVDGTRVYVLRVGEPAPPAAGPGDGGLGAGDGAPTSEDPVDLNTATEAQLDALPGVGPATAQAILQYRDEHGPFRSVDQLLEVPGIGEAKLAALRDLVRV